ncbi:GrlR family regulatory protein [Methylobacterium organophilum]|uniref:GrlR family regulatory protein n=1 Tax=Methylobacterium organophilum TaxID=410 RepID=UPI001EE18BC8|nr:GrlR family regulatory protein [Methylobacterium organophilum]
MKEGIYKIETAVGGTKLAGIAVFVGGKVYGGGEAIHFTGNYQVNDGALSLHARLDIHDPACVDKNINMLRDANVEISGKSEGSKFEMVGTISRIVGWSSRVTVTLTELPSFAV